MLFPLFFSYSFFITDFSSSFTFLFISRLLFFLSTSFYFYLSLILFHDHHLSVAFFIFFASNILFCSSIHLFSILILHISFNLFTFFEWVTLVEMLVGCRYILNMISLTLFYKHYVNLNITTHCPTAKRYVYQYISTHFNLCRFIY